MIKISVVGLGLMGQKRIASIQKNKADCQLLSVCDLNEKIVKEIGEKAGVRAYTSWQEMLALEKPDAIVVAVPNALAFPILYAAAEKKIHLFCEKPLGKNSREAACLYRLARRNNIVIKVGFSLRFHHAILEAWKLVQAGAIGRLLFGRAIYGHGGRPGYEKEWRASRQLAGGGELLDQGIHLIDLFRLFFGEIEEVFGFVANLFWKMEVEDNALAFLQTFSGQLLTMHASWTQWKNKFLFEIFGEKGYITVEGLGGNYGEEKLIFGLRKETIPETKDFIFPEAEKAFDHEFLEFLTAIKEKKEPRGSAWDGFMANLIVEAVYESAREEKRVILPRENQLAESMMKDL